MRGKTIPLKMSYFLLLRLFSQNAKRTVAPPMNPAINQLPVKIASHPSACAESTPPAPSRIARTLLAKVPINGQLGVGASACACRAACLACKSACADTDSVPSAFTCWSQASKKTEHRSFARRTLSAVDGPRASSAEFEHQSHSLRCVCSPAPPAVLAE